MTGFYQDIKDGDCITCATPCEEIGTIRPQCTGDEIRLPACRACAFSSGPMASKAVGVHFRYTTPNSCAIECLPGFSTALSCARCTRTLPDNSYFIGSNCEIKCKVSYHLDANQCVQCSEFPHPRRLSEVEAFLADNPTFFGASLHQGVDFEACDDNTEKRYGVLFSVSVGQAAELCGNGVLETAHEECDDGSPLPSYCLILDSRIGPAVESDVESDVGCCMWQATKRTATVSLHACIRYRRH